MDFETVVAVTDGVPVMGPVQGRRLYDHVVSTKPVDVLELGTAHGVSAAYIAAALEANGRGHLTTLDYARAGYVNPSAEEVLERSSLAHRVTITRDLNSSYNWHLRDLIEQQSDADGNCVPLFDFCFLDGAHNWTIDGLAVFLVEKLLRPGGWLLLDDLEWTYKAHDDLVDAPPPADKMFALSEAERRRPHVRDVFELLVKQHPAFTQFVEEDNEWGWAQKAPSRPRTFELASSRPLGALLVTGLRRTRRRLYARRLARRRNRR
jgi:predicted O-methyltransferase YrrM